MGQAKTDIYHLRAGRGDYVLRSVNDSSLSSHLAHGDALVGDPVPETPGMFFDAACMPVPPITVFTDAGSFFDSTGAVSLTGPIPDLGGITTPTPVTLRDATLTAPNDMFIGPGWSTLFPGPGSHAIALSGLEHLNVTLNSGPATAFGFYFHEPTSSTGGPDA